MSEVLDIIESKVKTQDALPNPFPGLRPFTMEESHLFFGREGQSDEVLLKISQNKFVAVIGASGSGKSSFMYCGVIPILHGGFLTNVGSNWDVVVMRPGGGPIDNLAQALLAKDDQYESADPEEKQIRKTITSTLLRSSSLGLVEAVDQLFGNRKNILLLVDQFEELFRFKKSEEGHGAPNESLAFVNLLVEAAQDKKSPVYVGVTMRSDFIGDCAQFPSLTKLINDSHYLIPQMTREQRRLAIVGPVAVAGGAVAPRLVQQLLNDLGDNMDQLPIMQHSLMRTWDYWKAHKEKNEPVDIEHYESIGRMAEALSLHANEAYEELNVRQKEICEKIFKALTEKGGDSHGIRRPTKLAILTELADCKEDEAIAVIDKFRQPGRSLLTPQAGTKLRGNSIIDISHESLMRIWVRLKVWVDEEGDAVDMYIRLAEAAAKYQLGKAGLWRPPDLQLALNWQEKHKPTLTWGQRYDPAFERTLVFLETSKEAHETEQRIKEMLQKRELQRARIIAIILGTAAVISILFLVYAFMAKSEADRATERALANEKEAIKQSKIAEMQRSEAEKQKLIAIEKEKYAVEQQKIAEFQKQEAEKQKAIALENEQKAIEQTKIAQEQTKIALEQRTIAESKEKEANEQRSLAEKSEKDAFRLRLLSIAQSMAVKSLQIEDTARKTLVAYQAYQFNKNNGGSATNHDIYDGLYYALKTLKEEEYNSLKGHTDAVRSVVYSSDAKNIYTAGSDGKILQWKSGDRETPVVIAQNGFINRVLSLSNDNKWLAAGSDMASVQLFDLTQTEIKPILLKGQQAPVSTLVFSTDNQTLYTTGSDGVILAWDVKNVTSTQIVKSNSKIKQLSINPINGNLAGVNDRGQVVQWDKANSYQERIILDKSNRTVHAISYSYDGKYLAFGNEAGKIKLWNLQDDKVEATLSGHKARINDLKFSKDGNMLASASFDGSVRLWNLTNMNEPPIEMKDHNSWVWSMAFSPDGNTLIAGCVDNLVRVWPTRLDYMADQMCAKLKRNMSDKEWQQYVAKDIPYELTCESKPKYTDIKEEE